MADRRKRSPAMRYIKRNGLYILIVCVLLLVVGAVIAVVGQVKRRRLQSRKSPPRALPRPCSSLRWKSRQAMHPARRQASRSLWMRAPMFRPFPGGPHCLQTAGLS